MITIVGQAFDPLGHSFRGHRVDVAELRNRQEGPIPLTLDHTRLAGRVLTLTRIGGGAIYAIAVGDLDPLLHLDQPLYLSPTTDTRAADGTDGLILDLALCLRTSRVAAQPVELLPGDVRESNDRARWALRGLTAELVTRAADELRCRPKHGPIHIRDLELEKWAEREDRRAAHLAQPLTGSRGRPVPPQARPGWKPGDIEWSQGVGHVLNVT